MAVFSFVLSAEGILRIRDVLVCLSRFNETVDIEATPEHLTLSALNSSKTSHAAFVLDRKNFFSDFEFEDAQSQRFGCQVFNKAFYTIFKSRSVDAKEQDTSIDRCEVRVLDDDLEPECRLVAKLLCAHGVKKTFKLTYEPIQAMTPSFNFRGSQNIWSISGQSLRALSEHFGARTEHIDFFHDAGSLLLTGYTEKIAKGQEILKHQLQTTITISREDFDTFEVDEHVHVGINAKDFRAIVLHAESLRATVSATYSQPTLPLQLAYGEGGLQSVFTLVTMREYLGNPIKLAPRPTNPPAPPMHINRPPAAPQSLQMGNLTPMAAPPLPPPKSFSRNVASRAVDRPSPPPPQASINQESLFLTEDDDEDERRWGAGNYLDDGDTVTWESGGDLPTRTSFRTNDISRMSMASERPGGTENEVPPTQRMSQIRGLFDE